MKLYANYHTHTELCGHAKGRVEDYVESAIKEGYKILGMSDHGPIPYELIASEYYYRYGLDIQMSVEEFKTVYLPDCMNVKRKYESKIQFLTGVEIEYFPNMRTYLSELKNTLDYLVLGMHFFPYKDGFYNVYEEMDQEKIMAYASMVCEAMNTGLYSVIAHPDIFAMKYKHQGKHLFDETCNQASRLIIESAIKNHVFLEINVGGFRREKFIENGMEKFGYPRFDFWKIVEEYQDAKIIIGVDAHDPLQLGDDDIDKAIRFANGFSFKIQEKITNLSDFLPIASDK